MRINQSEEDLDGTDYTAFSWREAMRNTLDILFHGRERFNNGDIFVKREILQSLGSNITIINGQLRVDCYKWLEPIKKSYPALAVES